MPSSSRIFFERQTFDQQLSEIWQLLGGGGDDAVPSATRTPQATALVASGDFPAGARNVTFLASSDFAGTLLGEPFAAGASLTFRADGNSAFGVFPMTRTAGTLYVYWF